MKPTREIRSILIANRGEIAVRIIRTCKELGIRSVAVFSDPDRSALHVQYADAAFRLPGSTAQETYLHWERIISIAKKMNVDAIHPGYGFLSENAEFADVVTKSGIAFVGPSSQSISLLGDKTAARALARKLGIPTVAGSVDALENEEKALTMALEIGFPVLLKAAAGGGGKGMRIVQSEREFAKSFQMAKSEARNAFNDDRVYLEKYIENPHHVEIQILGDHRGHVVYLGERDCSVQRRHQKVIEESPSPIIDDVTRRAMGDAAVHIAREASYANAGTVEFLVDSEKHFHFLEVNTRLQVEHPVTEVITGLDIVKEQIRIAEGRDLPLRQEAVRRYGHAIECRIYAEDPGNNFFPSTGKLTRYSAPTGPRTRVDNGAQQGDEITVFYDPMLAKVITWGETRSEAIATMKRALSEFRIQGIQSTIPFCLFVLSHEVFSQGKQSTGFVNQYLTPDSLSATTDPEAHLRTAIAAALIAERQGKVRSVGSDGKNTRGNWKSQRQEGWQ